MSGGVVLLELFEEIGLPGDLFLLVPFDDFFLFGVHFLFHVFEGYFEVHYFLLDVHDIADDVAGFASVSECSLFVHQLFVLSAE